MVCVYQYLPVNIYLSIHVLREILRNWLMKLKGPASPKSTGQDSRLEAQAGLDAAVLR